jgi:hypothetical protein
LCRQSHSLINLITSPSSAVDNSFFSSSCSSALFVGKIAAIVQGKILKDVTSSSLLHHLFIISSSSLHHLFIISSSSLHHLFIISSSSLRHLFVTSLSTLRHFQITSSLDHWLIAIKNPSNFSMPVPSPFASQYRIVRKSGKN